MDSKSGEKWSGMDMMMFFLMLLSFAFVAYAMIGALPKTAYFWLDINEPQQVVYVRGR